MKLIAGSCGAAGLLLAVLAFIGRNESFLISGCILLGAAVIATAIDRRQ